MPECINQSDVPRVVKEKAKPPMENVNTKPENSPKMKRTEPPAPTPQPAPPKPQPKPQPPPPPQARPSDDFPMLPGATAMYVPPTKAIPQEQFPALGGAVAVRPKDGWTAAQSSSQSKPAISHVAGIPVKVKKGKEKGKSWTQQRAVVNSNPDDFPSLGAKQAAPKPQPQQPKPQQQPKQSQPPPKPQPQPSKPSTDNTWQTAGRKPPGLSNTTTTKTNGTHHPATSKDKPSNHTGRGPPGLGAAGNRDSKPPGLPPGLSSASFPAPAPVAAAPQQQDNLRERNMRLWSLLQTFLDEFNMQIFKSVSGEFRKGESTAREYYTTISELLGDNLKFVFSELVALLPDDCESKRVELLQLNREAKLRRKEKENDVLTISSAVPKRAVWGANANANPLGAANNKPVDEAWCSECNRGFPWEDINKHMESHGEAFPSLPTAKKKTSSFPSAYSSKKVYQSQVHNPWSK